MNVIFIMATTVSLQDLHCNSSGNHISRSQIFGLGCVFLHESFSFAVDKKSSLTSSPFGYQTARPINTRRMKLHKLHVLQRKICSGNDSSSIASACVCWRAVLISSAKPTCRYHNRLASKSVNSAILHTKTNDSFAYRLIHEQIKDEIFYKKLAVVSHWLSEQCVKHWVSGSVSHAASSVCLASFSIFKGLTPKCSLINLSLFVSWEWHAIRL